MLSFDDFPKNSSENFAKLSILNENLGVDLSSLSLARVKLIFLKKTIEFCHIKSIFKENDSKGYFQKQKIRYQPVYVENFDSLQVFVPENSRTLSITCFQFHGKKNDNYIKIIHFMLTHLGNNYFISVKFDSKTSLFIYILNNSKFFLNNNLLKFIQNVID